MRHIRSVVRIKFGDDRSVVPGGHISTGHWSVVTDHIH